jgi:class 3 adenylate cyclase
MAPETRYARSGDLHIAYQVVGSGPRDLVLVDQWFSNVDAQWDFPPFARMLSRLASFTRLILFDKRGTGLSDPVSIDALPTLEEWIDDLRAVLDAAGSERTALLSGIGAAYMTLLFAATYPERTSALVLVDPFARVTAAPDYPWGTPIERLYQDLDRIEAAWGRDGGLLNVLGPNLLNDQVLVEQYIRYERASASPGAAKAMIRMLYESEVRHVLPTINVPTLVMHHVGGPRVAPVHGRYVAEHIAGARFVELPGNENYIWAGGAEELLGEIQEFLTGAPPIPEVDRVLSTVLFTDIVGSTQRAAELGDRRWRELLAEHDRDIRVGLERYRGREIKSIGDGFLATFDGPARAVRCAQRIRDSVASRGIEVRSGLHTGEIELAGDDVAGIAVHIAARVCALAGPGEVLASSTVKDLVAGSGIEFEPRGAHALKGVPGQWQIVAALG